MELLIATKKYEDNDAVQNFMDFYHSLNTNHLSSNLLDKGLSSNQTSDAVVADLKITKVAKLEVNAHFMTVFNGNTTNYY